MFSCTSKILPILYFYLTISLTPSCASLEERLIKVKNRVEFINNKVNNSNMVTGLAFKDEKRFNYRAYFIKDELVYVFADVQFSYYKASTNFYYFDDGQLIYYKQNLVGFDNAQSKRKIKIEMEIYFDSNDILESKKTTSGNDTEINNEEIQQIKEEAQLVYNAGLKKKKLMKVKQ